MKFGILASNFQSNQLQELERSKLASNRMRLNIARRVAEEKNIKVLPLDFYNELEFVDIVLIGKYVYQSGANKFIDDDGSRIKRWLKYIEYIKERNAKIVLDYTDHLIITEDERSEFYKEIIKITDIVITPSEMMRNNINKYFTGRIEVVEDPLEIEIKKIYNNNYEKLNALWFGHPTNLNYLLRILKNLSKLTSLTIVTSQLNQNEQKLIKNINPILDIKFYEWEKNFYEKFELNCNICLLPSDIKDSKKNGVSDNRLITAFALGLVPIVSPVESYKKYENYYLDINEFSQYDKKSLEIINSNLIKDRSEILRNYLPNMVGAKWASILFENKSN